MTRYNCYYIGVSQARDRQFGRGIIFHEGKGGRFELKNGSDQKGNRSKVLELASQGHYQLKYREYCRQERLQLSRE
jgi:hypothetical protein